MNCERYAPVVGGQLRRNDTPLHAMVETTTTTSFLQDVVVHELVDELGYVSTSSPLLKNDGI